jgi:hypothetical protein
MSYEEKKSQGWCTRRWCRTPASLADDSQLCQRHLKRKREQDAASAARRRAAREADGLCVWCPAAKPRPATQGSTACLPCRIKRNRLKIEDGVGTRLGHQDRAAAIAAATRKDPDGRTRYHGQGRRGQQTYATLNAQDLRLAKTRWEPFSAGVTIMDTEEFKALHRGEREEVKKAICRVGNLLSGHIDDILERLGHFQTRHGRRDEDK